MTRWRGVRWSADAGFELRCELCAASGQACWWPLMLEFWAPERGMTRCRACWNAYYREYAAGVRASSRRIVMQLPIAVAERQEIRRRYKREWMARKRAAVRASEGRGRYERRKVA